CLLTEQGVQHLLVRAGLHDRADTRDMHAEEGKQHGCNHRAGDTRDAVSGKELDDLVPGCKTTADDHRHIGQCDLKGVFVHSCDLYVVFIILVEPPYSRLTAVTDISTRMSCSHIPASTVARAGATPSGSQRSHTAFMPAKSRSISFR